MKKHWFKHGLVVCGAMLAVTGCGSSAPTSTPTENPPAQEGTGTQPPAEPVTVRFSEVIRSIFYAPQYVAMEKGFFEEEGLKVDMVTWRPGSAPQMVMSHVMNKHQVKDAEVITNTAAPAMVGAFESGNQEYIQLYEPVASMLEEQGKAYVVASLGEAVGTFPETSYAATNEVHFQSS